MRCGWGHAIGGTKSYKVSFIADPVLGCQAVVRLNSIRPKHAWPMPFIVINCLGLINANIGHVFMVFPNSAEILGTSPSI